MVSQLQFLQLSQGTITILRRKIEESQEIFNIKLNSESGVSIVIYIEDPKLKKAAENLNERLLRVLPEKLRKMVHTRFLVFIRSTGLFDVHVGLNRAHTMSGECVVKFIYDQMRHRAQPGYEFIEKIERTRPWCV